MVNSFWSFPCFSIPHPPDAPTRILGMYVLVTVFLFCGHKKLTLDMLSQATWSQASITHTQLGTAAVIITVYLPVRRNQEIRFSFCRGFFFKGSSVRGPWIQVMVTQLPSVAPSLWICQVSCGEGACSSWLLHTKHWLCSWGPCFSSCLSSGLTPTWRVECNSPKKGCCGVGGGALSLAAVTCLCSTPCSQTEGAGGDGGTDCHF